MHKKYTVIIATFLMVCSTIVSVLSPVVANAASVDDMDLPTQIKSYNLYHALSQCAQDFKQEWIYDDDAGSGNWFSDSGNDRIVGYVASPDNKGDTSCNTILSTAKDMWRYDTYTSMLKAFGYTHKNVGQKDAYWVSSSTPASDMLPAIRKKVYGGADPVYQPYFNYYELYTSFIAGCEPSNPRPGPINADDKAVGDVEITVVDGTSTSTTVYSYKDNTLDYGYAPLAGGDHKLKCSTIASNLNQATAAQYLSTLPKNLKDDTPKKQCTQSDSSDCAPDTASTCNIEGIGWLLCPVLTFIGKIVDGTYSVVSAMLTVPAVDTSTKSPLYQAWSMIRNFANVAFVIAFLVIIYSQITGMGVTNYGIKKLLPRIIAAAILVNVSYWLCAIAVDISNIVGASVKELFDSMAVHVTPKKLPDWTTTGAGKGFDVAWSMLVPTIIGGTIITGVVWYSTLAVFLPIIISALVAVITVVVVLTVRQALVVLLIVLAPLAFVAYLLPNTEKWYKRWQETIVAMLVMFPIIAAIFGASKLASVIVMQSAQGFGDDGNAKFIVQIMAAGIQIVPLAISPLIMKFSSGVLGKVGAFVNNPNKGPFDRMRKSAEGYRDFRKGVLKPDRAKGGKGIIEGAGGVLGGSNSYRRRVASRLRYGRSYANNQRDNSRKQQLETAESKLDEMYNQSAEGIIRGGEATNAKKRADIAKATVEEIRMQSAEGMRVDDDLKKSEVEDKMNKALAERRFTVDPGNIDLRMRAKEANLELDQANAVEDSQFKEAMAGQAVAGVAQTTIDAAKQAAESKYLYEQAAGSATREMQQQHANAVVSDPGKARTAGGNNPNQIARVIANAAAAQDAAKAESIKNEVANIQRTSTPDTLIDNAAKTLTDATANGDDIGVRAAAQILRSTGSKGLDTLHDTIATLESSPGGIPASVGVGLKYDLSSAGLKGKDSTLDAWSVGTNTLENIDKGYSAKVDSNTGTYVQNHGAITRLNEVELAGQTYKQLKTLVASGSISKPQAQSIIAANDEGTVPLDEKKKALFTSLI